jgi:type I restriction enzyme R subunit
MRLTESKIENFAIDLLVNLGFEYIYGPTIAPDGEQPERQAWDDVILAGRFNRAVNTLNPTIPEAAREQAIRDVMHITSPELINNNETFHRYLTGGVDVEFQKDGITRGDKVWLVDFDHPENNEFLVFFL